MTETTPDRRPDHRLPDNEFAQDTLKANLDNPAAPRLLHWLPASFLLAVVGVGAALSLWVPGIWKSPGGKSVMLGSWQTAFEHTYDQLHPVRTPGVDGFGVVNYALFREGRPGVLIGQGGWLYTTEEFQTALTDAAEISGKLAEIGRVRATLATRGTRLLVLLVPAKSRVYPEHLGRYRWPAVKRNVYEAFRRQLQNDGVLAPDLLPALVAAKSRGEVFLHTDTHWTPLGAQVAAGLVEESLTGLTPRLELPKTAFTLQLSPAVSHAGDLLKYVPLGGWQSQMGPVPDRLSTPNVRAAVTPENGLLGGDAPSVTLVGTSYSANARWGFEALLKHALATDLINAAQEGKGPMIPMREYLTSSTYKTSAPKLLIWEIPERFLTKK
ncbi:alginate O-acetyltransferase AlgX-related protein [Deinococcus sp.]|uniref:alginate O-acetyltransferase AlgX-related protein n=1 Tax=Deinococcus sp. TaxID=47478 RepID=UPI003C7A798A